MVNLTIDGIAVRVPEGTTILDAARSVGIQLPTLCYLKNVNSIGACRICLVEAAGYDRLLPSCNTVAEDGMKIQTNSPRVREARRTNVELLLSQHDVNCAACVRSNNCAVQTISNDLGIVGNTYKKQISPDRWPADFPLIRHESRCIKCMRCVQVCTNIQNIGIWDSVSTGGYSTVGVSANRDIKEADCTLCGQCITHCPVGALRERDDTDQALEVLEDPDITTVVQIAPAVRTAWAEYFGLPREKATIKLMAAALRKIGFDYIFDTDFSADLTIMEEGSEFVEYFSHRDKHVWPLFTSCCPGWVRFLKSQYPEYVDNLSSAKSPQQMFGAVAKSYFAKRIGVDPRQIRVVSIMPCVAKKSECAQPNQNDACGDPDVDIVLTTREIVRMFRSYHILPEQLQEEELDSPLGTGSGAAVIFGASGGVMDAALRSAYYMVTGEDPDPDAFQQVRGMEGWKEAQFEMPGAGTVHVAVASGLGNARRLMEAIRHGRVHYDFVEIMACPGGCAGGGGQPIHDGRELAGERGDVLWRLDAGEEIRYSHRNPETCTLYKEYLGKPMGELAHRLLHTDHKAWIMPESPKRSAQI